MHGSRNEHWSEYGISTSFVVFRSLFVVDCLHVLLLHVYGCSLLHAVWCCCLLFDISGCLSLFVS